MDEHKGRLGGLEPICRVLSAHDCKIAPSTYYAHHKRRAEPAARTVRDRELKALIQESYEANYRVYGARKTWRLLNRQGVAVARCTVERLMRELGITGAVRGKRVITTIPDASAQRAPDLVDRDFVAPAPNRCWVADFTHVATFAGVVYVAFVVDTFSRRIVGWSAATSKETRLVLDALEMAFVATRARSTSLSSRRVDTSLRCRVALHIVRARRAPGPGRHRRVHRIGRRRLRLSVSS
ncbi:IS3 family transposase, partial [Streptomyces sp. NPDC058258]|uniref:IS3 family transposase n=1 Tax=Streptomyces sp. NPDC058258 TaxID=3346410 RepID=UPI0036EE94A9